ncbi:hypothetical protein [Bifidobacterium simiiventris]|uniref:hypothetical protein n=1 Tax=Bifidobacterium simiiventris TaxID=2834434 RepID=UPI001C59A38C|nr:hypothetical protein [Bifidobacterium simiiventris]MBW3077792.1 hypothetical protein [Bifidobacterium simiiventris]
MPGRQMTALLAVSCILLGAGTASIIVAPHTPRSLSAADPNASIAIERRTTDDARSITIDAEEIAMPPVTAPRSGMVTASSCEPGAVLSSGTSLVSIDGRGVLMLAAKQPFWRDLPVGARGEDAASLNDALTAIRAGTLSGDTITNDTIEAFKTVSANVGHPLPDDYTTIRTTDMAWLPADTVSVATCPAVLGQELQQGEPIAVLPAVAGSAKAESLPSGVASGKRVVLAGDERLNISDTGEISDLTSFSRSLPFLSSGSQNGVRKISVQWALRTPVEVGVVPASAIGTTPGSDSQACVVIDGRALPVRVVGSMLGRSYIQTMDGTVPDGDVRLAPNVGGCS